LNLLEWKARRRKACLDEKLAGLSAGNPKRATARPTAEKMLAAFKEITLLLIEELNQLLFLVASPHYSTLSTQDLLKVSLWLDVYQH
jgi:hypothetical protein